ncbi:hypothetical protein O181_022361 [Austropuccinia psidii MF-1]|uniref:Tf2-1-like SH3-like domain-containing protein n=1 Tax=Austropuccinia psidii MF-1 TaxID=1389203 RepID=A0A9Q3CHA7_9BASI|nr:hypothetical protein [Austropuccinia psidii MF-1]
MDWVTGLPAGGDESYNAFLVIVDRFSKTPIFLPCQKDDTFMHTALLIWNRVVLLHAVELEYRTSIHSSTNKTPSFLERQWNSRLPQYSLRKELVELQPTAASFKGMLEEASNHAVRCMEDSFSYSKDKWKKSNGTPNLGVGDLVLLSTTNFNNIKGCKKLKDSFAGPFDIKAHNGENGIEVELFQELSNRHPTFPVSLIMSYKQGHHWDSRKIPQKNAFSSLFFVMKSFK